MAEQMLGEYVVRRLIGRGGAAEVWEGVDPDLDRPVAIKVILPQVVGDPDFAARFRREAKRVAALHHPHIVRLFDFGLKDGQAMLAMEYLPGGTLRRRLDDLAGRGQFMPPHEIAGLLDALAGALDYAHSQGVVHRDLTPANILFAANGDAVICDFGIAEMIGAGANLGATGGMIGAPAYMSPEQANGEDVDSRSDLYSLGAILYEMVTGRAPGAGAAPGDRATLPRTVNPPPPAVEAVLARALAREPAARFQGGGELAAAYRAAVGLASGEARHPVETEKPADTQLLPGEMRWLHKVLDVSALAAALLGRNAPAADELPRDRRSLIALLLTTLGIFVAVLQFLLNMFSLLEGSAQLLARALPVLVVLLLLGGIGLTVFTLVRSPSALRRRQAGGLLAVIFVVLAGWGAWWSYAQIKPPEGFVILIGEFEAGENTERVAVDRYIAQSLDQELSHLGGLASAVRSGEVYESAEEARRSGIRHDATLVIWGWYDAGGISPRIEVLDIPDLGAGLDSSRLLIKAAGFAPVSGLSAASDRQIAAAATDLSTFVYQPAVLPSVDLFIQDGPQELAYVASTVLGIAFYANGDAEHALELLDRALALAEPLENPSAIGKDRVYFHRGVIKYNQGRLADAAADLEQAVAIQPNLYEAQYNLAMVYAQLCNPARQLLRAVAAAEAAVAVDPGRAEGHRLLGNLYIEQEQYEKAIAALQQAAQQEPDEPSTYDLLASAYMGAGQLDTAKAAARQALALYEQNAATQADDPLAARLDLGYAHLRAEEYERALDEFTAAAALAPDDPLVHRALGNVYYWRGDPGQAIEEYRRWAELAPSDVDAHLLLGLTLSEQGDVGGAIASVRRSADLNACDAGPYSILGNLYWQAEDLAAAAEAYGQAVAIEPDDAETLLLLGSVRYFQGDLAAAQTALERSVELNPSEPEAHRALGLVYVDLGDYPAAATSYAKLTELLPDDPLAFTSLGSVYLGLSEWEKAADAYRRALELEPSADSHISLAIALYQLGEIDASISELEQALASDPNNAGAHSTLGDAYVQQGRLEEAAAEYLAALQGQETAYARSQLASIYSAEGRTDDALREMERAVELEPGNWYYRYLLGELSVQTGDLDAAAAHYQAALEANPEAAMAYYGLSLTAYRQCRLSAAAQAIGKAVSLDENSTTYLGLQAAIYWAQNRVDEAKALYARLQAAPPGDWAAHLAAGDYLYQMGELDAAAQEFQALLEETDAAPLLMSLAYTALGKVYYVQDRLLPASAEYESALTAFAANADATALLGDIALRSNDPMAALEAYDAALGLLPSFGRFFPPETSAQLEVSIGIRRGFALERLGREEGAAAARATALARAQALAKRFPSSPSSNVALSVAYEAMGNVKQAEWAYAAAVECDRSVEITVARFRAELAKLQVAGE